MSKARRRHAPAPMKVARIIGRLADLREADLGLISPAMTDLPQGLESVAAMLPVHNLNGWLDATSVTGLSYDERCFPALFAADPFLDLRRTFERLRHLGFSRVALWPSIGIFDGSPNFASDGLGFEREVHSARIAVAAGFSLMATVFDSAQAQRMIEAGVTRLILHPPPGRLDYNGHRLADWIRTVFPSGRPSSIETCLIATAESPPSLDNLPLVDGILACGSGRSVLKREIRTGPSDLPRRSMVPSAPHFLSRRRGSIIVGAAVGTGAAAHAVVNGGADFVVALSAGRFRMMGVPSSSSYLPLRDTNSFVDGFALDEILPRVEVPVFLGVCAFDPRRDVGAIVAKALEHGYPGITNFPTVARYSGRYRKCLEANGLGIRHEFELLARAKEAGLLTLAYTRAPDEAAHFASLGVDVLCLQFGSNADRLVVHSQAEVEDIAGQAGAIIRRVRAHNAALPCLLSGGAIVSPETVMRVCDLAKADGYIGGSTFDQFPMATSIEDRTAEFKAALQLRYETEGIEKQIRLYRRFGLVTTQSDSETVHNRVRRLASSRDPIIITGARGTGKSLLAKLIHALGPRKARPLENLSLDDTAGNSLQHSLTGAAGDAAAGIPSKLGWFQVLSGQDLVLDDLDKASLPMQAFLLETMETGRFRQAGAITSLPFDVRLILTSREPLAELRSTGRMDDDLYLRLRPAEIQLQALRSRPEDIPVIVDFFLEDLASKSACGIEHAAVRSLQAYDWPGNMRELRSFLQEALVLAHGRKISLEDLETVRHNRAAAVVHPTEVTEREWISDALRRHRYRRADTAAYLGISRKTLYNKMRHFRLLGDH
jgi:predicted TIM-barrel enzyme/transcriptional regulator with AAA-type ATPase domain